jgi:hypothetical protein
MVYFYLRGQKMEMIKEAIKCAECKSVLESPVFLPCSDSICKKHVKEGASEFHCLACDIIHQVPNVGFPVNKALAVLLKRKIQNSKFSPEYNRALESIKHLENKVDEAKLFQRDPHFFINKVISELKSETDILRDEFKLAIDQKADAIIKDLDEYEQECKSNLNSRDVAKKLDEMSIIIREINDDLAAWQETLRDFDAKEEILKLIKENGVRYKSELQSKLNEYESDFLMRKIGGYQQKVLSFCKTKLQSNHKLTIFRSNLYYALCVCLLLLSF